MRHIAAIALERDPDDFPILHHGPAAVAGINLCADLDREVLIDRGVGVELKVDARDDAGRDGHALAADRITVGRDGRFQLGNSAQGQGGHVLRKIGRRHFDQSQIAIVRHKQDAGRIFLRVALSFDREVTAVTHDVGIGHDAVAGDDEPRADSPLNPARIPRRLVVRIHPRSGDADEAVLDLGVRRRRETGRAKKSRAKQKEAAGHAQESGKMKQMTRKSNSGPLEQRTHDLLRFENFAGDRARGAGVMRIIGVDHLHRFSDFA